MELPVVLRKSGNQYYDLTKIRDSLVKETDLDIETAADLSIDVTRFIMSNDLKIITAPLIREITNVCLLKRGFEKQRLQYTRIGLPYYDLNELYHTRDFEKFKMKIIGHMDQEYRAVGKLIGECEQKG